MKLDVITLKEKKRWDDIVSLFKLADVYYLSDYVQGFKLHGDGEPLLFFFSEENSNNKALNVVMKRDISEDSSFIGKIEQNKYFDLATPYGYGGMIYEVSGNQQKFLQCVDKTYNKYCNENNIICEFVRFHPNIENGPKVQEIYNAVQLGETVCMDLSDKDLIWSNIISKNRNVIRKAQKSGVEIRHGMSESLIKEFISLYNSTMDRDHAAEYYYFAEGFYNSIMEDLKGNSTIFYAVYEDKVIAASIILFSGERMHYHLSASNADYRSLAPTNLLLYEAACWGSDNGYKSFHLGGGLGSKEDNLFRFKKAFNKQKNTQFWIGRKIFNDTLYRALLEIRKQESNFDENTGFFPKYRG
ncbi:MAG: lipid II:glycine glycyltransferase FemX [Aminipila sp.]